MRFQKTTWRSTQHSNEYRREGVGDLLPYGRSLPSRQAKPIDIDKETSSTILFDEFVEMATPKMQSRDTREEIMKVFQAGWGDLFLFCVGFFPSKGKLRRGAPRGALGPRPGDFSKDLYLFFKAWS